MYLLYIQETVSVSKLWQKGNPCTLLVELCIGAATMENTMEVSQNIKHRVIIWPNKFTSIHPGEMKTYAQNIHSSIIHNQKMETAQMSIDYLTDK